MPRQIPLPVTVDVEPPRNTTALNGGLPDRGVDRLPSPRDIARQTHIHRKQARHRALLAVSHRGYPLTSGVYAPRIAASVATDCGLRSGGEQLLEIGPAAWAARTRKFDVQTSIGAARDVVQSTRGVGFGCVQHFFEVGQGVCSFVRRRSFDQRGDRNAARILLWTPEPGCSTLALRRPQWPALCPPST
jgi:hypothetical protein